MRAQGVMLGGAVYLAIACGSACGGDQTTPSWGSWGDDGGTTSGSGGSSGSSSGATNGSSGSGSGSANGSGSGSGSAFGSSSGSTSGSTPSGSGSGGAGTSSSSGGGNGSSSSGSTTGSSSGGTGSSSGSSSGGASGANPPDCSTATGWKDGNETVFESYPPPGSAECIQYSGCQYEGQFQACGKTVSQSWVQSHNIFSVFPNLSTYQYHWICLKDPGSGKTIAGLALDTCANSDCGGCCTQNLGSASLLIDVEINTDARFTNLGINGGQSVQWADLGPADPSAYAGCN